MLWTAFTIGLLGSLHCVGMCGPIALAASAGQSSVYSRYKFTGRLLMYNFGRTVTYTLLGSVIGLLGKGIFLAGMQKGMSIGLGVTLLVIAIFSINVETKLLKIPGLKTMLLRLKTRLGVLLKNHTLTAVFGVGILNGLLPCGLVYMAVAGALGTGGVLPGMAYMALFGLGTFPLMLITGFAGNWAGLRTRSFLRKISPVFLVLFALLFLFRGLNFYLPADFFFLEKMTDLPMCH